MIQKLTNQGQESFTYSHKKKKKKSLSLVLELRDISGPTVLNIWSFTAVRLVRKPSCFPAEIQQWFWSHEAMKERKKRFWFWFSSGSFHSFLKEMLLKVELIRGDDVDQN